MSNVDINVDRRTDGRTDGKSDAYIATSRCDKNTENTSNKNVLKNNIILSACTSNCRNVVVHDPDTQGKHTVNTCIGKVHSMIKENRAMDPRNDTLQCKRSQGNRNNFFSTKIY